MSEGLPGTPAASTGAGHGRADRTDRAGAGGGRAFRAGSGRRRAAGRDRHGPVFVDGSGRRSRLLRRASVLFGLLCLGYAAILVLAFMGGISLTPDQVMPFDGGGPAVDGGPGGPPPSMNPSPAGTAGTAR